MRARSTARTHPALWLAGLVGLAAWPLLPGRAQAPVLAPTVDLYTGGSPLTEGLKLGGWGSGMATEDRAYKTAGETSIKVETHGFFAGARIQFDTPREITAQKNDAAGFLELIARFQPGRRSQTATPQGIPGGFMGGSSSGDSGDSGDGGFSGGFMGGVFAGGAPVQQSIAPDTRKLRVMLICEEGTYTVTNFPLNLLPATEEGWFSVAIPFVAFKDLERAQTAKVKEIRVFGDTRDTFWIGEIRTTTDDEPIAVDALDDQEVSVGEAVEFRASATGGISPLQYSWDFDRSDGIQEDAVGQVVIHVYRRASLDTPGRPGEPQPYLATLTVRDLSGAKKPARREASVIVNR